MVESFKEAMQSQPALKAHQRQTGSKRIWKTYSRRELVVFEGLSL